MNDPIKHAYIPPSPLRRIVFPTEQEWEAAREDLDQLLAWAWSVQHQILDHLPASRERDIAVNKLEEFVCYTRLAVIGSRTEAVRRTDHNSPDIPGVCDGFVGGSADAHPEICDRCGRPFEAHQKAKGE